MVKNKKVKSILMRWFFARLLCLTHLGVAIFLLFVTKMTRGFFFLAIIGIGLIALEIIVSSFLKFRFQYSFVLFLIYSVCIISSIWLLELYRIHHLITVTDQQASVEVFSIIYYAPIQPSQNFFLFNKFLWSEIQIQAYIFIIVILKGLVTTQKHRLDVIVKTWTTALDILDFIDLLSHPQLYCDLRFVYVALSVWSISCLQFIFQISTMKRILMKLGCHRLACLMTDSLLSMIITDVPYLIIRLYAILGVSRHDYTSYFLVFKNIMVIVLQTANVCLVFQETTSKKTKPTSI